MKAKIVAKVDLDVETLPHHTQLLDFLVVEKERGRYLVLTTATNQKYAHQVAQFPSFSVKSLPTTKRAITQALKNMMG